MTFSSSVNTVTGETVSIGEFVRADADAELKRAEEYNC